MLSTSTWMRACYAADAQAEPVRAGQLHVAIAGGGATGVELAAELQHSLRTLVGYGLNNIDVESDIRLHLIEASPRLLPGLAERVSRATTAVLNSLDILVHTGELIVSADEHGFVLKSGARVDADIKVWAAGIRGEATLAALDGLEVNRINQLVCLPSLQPLATRTFSRLATVRPAPWLMPRTMCHRAPRPPTSRPATCCG